jgi:hypothetical protein
MLFLYKKKKHFLFVFSFPFDIRYQYLLFPNINFDHWCLQEFQSSYGPESYLGLEVVEAHLQQGVQFTAAADSGRRLSLKPLYSLAYKLQSLIGRCHGGQASLADVEMLYAADTGVWLRPQLYECHSMEQLLTKKLSLFFVVENTAFSSKMVRLCSWPTNTWLQPPRMVVPTTASGPSTSERAEDGRDTVDEKGRPLAVGRVTPDIIGHVSRRQAVLGGQSSSGVKKQTAAQQPVEFKSFRIEPRGRGLGCEKGEVTSQRYGLAFPHSRQALPASLPQEETATTTASRRDYIRGGDPTGCRRGDAGRSVPSGGQPQKFDEIHAAPAAAALAGALRPHVKKTSLISTPVEQVRDRCSSIPFPGVLFHPCG